MPMVLKKMRLVEARKLVPGDKIKPCSMCSQNELYEVMSWAEGQRALWLKKISDGSIKRIGIESIANLYTKEEAKL